MLHHLTHITARVNDDEVAKSPAISDDDAARNKKKALGKRKNRKIILPFPTGLLTYCNSFAKRLDKYLN